MAIRTSNWSVLEGCWPHIDQRAGRAGRAESLLAEEVRKSPLVSADRIPEIRLRTEELGEPGHTLAGRTGLEGDSLADHSPAGCSLVGRTDCKGLTWCREELIERWSGFDRLQLERV